MCDTSLYCGVSAQDFGFECESRIASTNPRMQVPVRAGIRDPVARSDEL